MSLRIRQLALSVIVTLGSVTCAHSVALAHPGHGDNDADRASGPAHYVTEPVHAAPVAAVVIFFAARWYRAEKRHSETVSADAN